jgi:transcriptional regulator with XRE-family HTH domain
MLPGDMSALPTATVTRLQEWRLRQKLTLQEIADLTGLSPAMVSRVERGQRQLAPVTRARFARRLGVRIPDLFPVEGSVEAPADAA